MAVDWTRTAVERAVRTTLLRSGAVTDGFSGVDVRDLDDELLVLFRWRRDPNTFGVRFPYPDEYESPWTGLPVDAVEEWALELASLLCEELDTGLVRRAPRTVRDGFVELGIDDAPDVAPAAFYISEVPVAADEVADGPALHVLDGPPIARTGWRLLLAVGGRWGRRRHLRLGEPGWFLAEAGLDVTVPRRLLAEGRLLCWLQAYADTETGEPVVGQAAASWVRDQPATTRLNVLDLLPGTPTEVASALAHRVVHDAAAAGALRVITAIDTSATTILGFRRSASGDLLLRTTESMDGATE